jgi:hypothetical protein
MDAPKSIERQKVDGRDATVVHLANGMVKVIWDDGEMAFLVPKPKDEATPAREKTDA